MKRIFGGAVALLFLLRALNSISMATSLPGVVIAWGDGVAGQTNVPANLTNATSIAGGYYHSLALKSDGTVVAWGSNTNGQSTVPASLSNVVAIAAGDFHSLALKADHTVVAWGAGAVLNAGDGIDYGQSIVPAGLTGVLAIAAGSDHSLALKTNGTVVGWGFNNYGQTNIPARLSNVVAIATAGYHCLALKNDTTVVAWGFGGDGETNIPQGLSNVVSIACGWNHNLALKADGSLIAWGYNGLGQSNLPSGLTNITQLASDGNQRAVLEADGSVTAWGWIDFSKAPTVPTGLPPATTLVAGVNHLMLLTSTPFFTAKPLATISLPAGAGTNLSFTVQSASALSFLWRLNGSQLPGFTGPTFNLANFSLAQAGAYTTIVSNQYSAITNVTVIRLTNSPVVLVDGVDVGGGTVSPVNSTQITMTSAFGANAPIYYTLDGSTPDFSAIPYSGSFALTNSGLLRAVAYNAAFSLSAEAAPINVQIIPTFALTLISAGGGSIQVAPLPYAAGNNYVSNTVVTITAVPTNGWQFIDWSGDVSGTNLTTTVTMNRARSAQAIFGAHLNLVTNGNGSIILAPTSGIYPYGQLIQLTAVPNPGSYFFGWGDALSGFNDPVTISLNSATAGITALFATLASNQVSLTVMPDPSGSVTVSPLQKFYTNGQTVTLTAVPVTNYSFASWGGAVSTTTNPLVLNLNASTWITASFTPGIITTNPTVITQSPLNRTLGAGANTALTVQATGSALTYQWRLNGVALSSATKSVLSLVNINSSQAGRYDAVVTGTGGTATSSVALVALLGLQFTPTSNQPLPLLIMDAAVGSQYNVQYSTNATMTNWNVLVPVTFQNARSYYIDLPNTNFPKKFYRLVPQ